MKSIISYLVLLIFSGQAMSQNSAFDKIYIIGTAMGNDNIDVSNGLVSAGNMVWLYQANNTASQKWVLKRAKFGNYYFIESIKTGPFVQGAPQVFSLTVRNSATDGGGFLCIDPVGNMENQLWSLQDAGDGSYYLMSKYNGYYLTVDASKPIASPSQQLNVTGYRIFLTNRPAGPGINAQKWRFRETN